MIWHTNMCMPGGTIQYGKIRNIIYTGICDIIITTNKKFHSQVLKKRQLIFPEQLQIENVTHGKNSKASKLYR